MSLRSRLMVAFVAVSLLSMAAVSGLAYWFMLQRYEEQRVQSNSQNFLNDVKAFLSAYGTWQDGGGQGGFRHYVQQRPHTQAPVSARELIGMGQGPQRPAGGRPGAPVFRYHLFDTDGNSLFDLPPYRLGQAALSAHREQWQPVSLHGATRAYYVPEGVLQYSEQDYAYIRSLRQALLQGSALGVLVTLLLGWWLGARLVQRLQRLSDASQAMAAGQWQQQVPEDAPDEIGVLSRNFNHMSRTLAAQYAELSTSHARMEQMAVELRELSQRDALTQLHNRRYFDEQSLLLMSRAKRYQLPLCLVLGDVDHFKSINDRFSHAVGDEVLRRIGTLLKDQLRSVDLVARYGGEEFVVAFSETTLPQAQRACELLRQRVASHPWHEVHPELHVTMSFGVCDTTAQADIGSALRVADEMLYRAKSLGRNRVCAGNEAQSPFTGPTAPTANQPPTGLAVTPKRFSLS